jgi:hypothetical protein
MGNPRPGDDTGGLLWNCVMCDAGIDAPRSSCRVQQRGYRLEAGGGQHGVHVLTGHRCAEAVALDIGFGRPEHPAPDLG